MRDCESYIRRGLKGAERVWDVLIPRKLDTKYSASIAISDGFAFGFAGWTSYLMHNPTSPAWVGAFTATGVCALWSLGVRLSAHNYDFGK